MSQLTLNSGGIPKKIFEKDNFERKSADDKTLPSMQIH